jgi:formylmethanofuran dehydrogenase subunit E
MYYWSVFTFMEEKAPNKKTGKKRGRKKSVAYCSVCQEKIGIRDSYVVGDKYACEPCMKKIVKRKKKKV